MSSQMMGIGVDYVATPRPAACRFWLHHSAMTWMYNSGPSRGGTTCRPSDPACTSTFSMTPHRDATSQRRCSCPRAGGSSMHTSSDRRLTEGMYCLKPLETSLPGTGNPSQHVCVRCRQKAELSLVADRCDSGLG